MIEFGSEISTKQRIKNFSLQNNSQKIYIYINREEKRRIWTFTKANLIYFIFFIECPTLPPFEQPTTDLNNETNKKKYIK